MQIIRFFLFLVIIILSLIKHADQGYLSQYTSLSQSYGRGYEKILCRLLLGRKNNNNERDIRYGELIRKQIISQSQSRNCADCFHFLTTPAVQLFPLINFQSFTWQPFFWVGTQQPLFVVKYGHLHYDFIFHKMGLIALHLLFIDTHNCLFQFSNLKI